MTDYDFIDPELPEKRSEENEEETGRIGSIIVRIRELI